MGVIVIQCLQQLALFTHTLFLFCGRCRDRIKTLYREGHGFLLLYIRLESGSFQCPRNCAKVIELTPQQYRWLIEDLSVEKPKTGGFTFGTLSLHLWAGPFFCNIYCYLALTRYDKYCITL